MGPSALNREDLTADAGRVRQVSALDAQFLNFETATNVANIGGVAVLESDVTREDILVRVKARLPVIPQLRRRLDFVPLGLDHPYWVDDEVDLDHHVRELRLPPPGGDRQLGGRVARLHERRLDRDRPLWEMYLIHGLAGGRCAVYTKVHHAAVDGITGAEVLAALTDLAPPPVAHEYEDAPPLWHKLARSVGHAAANPAYLLKFLLGAVPMLDRLPDLPAPATPLGGPVSAHRRYAFAELPLRDVKRVKDEHGGTVNDVIMALTAGALRRWLLAHDALPELPLVAGVPFSLRDRPGVPPGNQVTIMLAALPTHLPDPFERLAAVNQAMRAIKEHFDLTPASWLSDLSQSLPAALNGLADRAAFDLLGRTSPPINVIVSNIPGPQFPLRIAGARLLGHYPVSVVTDVSGGLNITAFSYDGRIDLGITACRDRVPDVWDFPGYLRDALAELA